MEIWDAYDKDFNKIEDMTRIRGEEASIPVGIYHLVCNILVQHKDGTYLLMQRDPGKAYPLLWEASAGGYQCTASRPCTLNAAHGETAE